MAAALMLGGTAFAAEPPASGTAPSADAQRATVAPQVTKDQAAKPGKSKKTTELQSVVVTGTFQAGLSPIESKSPIDVFSGEQITQQSSPDLTTSLTNVVPSLSTQRFPIADGSAFIRPVSLRNLSPDQTLVLVNGVRFHRSALVNLQIDPLGTFNQGSQGVDFSVFPSGAIDHVEVLRDGASVLYGSDAIAGVVNVILKDSPHGASVSAQWGEYGKGDGPLRRYDADVGFPLGGEGFLHLSAEHVSSGPTSRGIARPDATAVAAIVGADKTPFGGLGQRWGDPATKADKMFINAGVPITEGMEAYGYGNYMKKKVLSSFFYRDPVLPGIAGRSTLVSYQPGTLTPADAPQSLVDSILSGGGDPSNYLTSDANSPSGFILLNPIYKGFPGGYTPMFGADISDHQLVGGIRGGQLGNLQWNVHYRTGMNQVDYLLKYSINPSLGQLSPTTFRPGKLSQHEQGLGVDFVQTFDDSSLTLAYGALWRSELYSIRAGGPASITAGPTAAIFGVGSDGFQGFPTDAAGRFKQNSRAVYFDAEGNLTDNWSAAAAVRYVKASSYASKAVYKLSTRYVFNDQFAARATYNTGFRTPTPGQANTLNVTTSANSAGVLIPSGTYPVDDPVARAMGSVPLRTETSRNASLGVVWTPVSRVTATLDFYQIRIKDRIGLVSKIIDQNTVDILNNEGYPNASLLLGSHGSYFSNAFDSRVSGFDFVLDTTHDLGKGKLNVDLRYNHNVQTISNIKPDTLNNDFAYDLENQVPKDRAVLSFNYDLGRFGATARINHYGSWSTTAGLFGSNNPPQDVARYGSKSLLDLEARYKFNDTFSAAVGGNNVFNTYPDKEQNPTLRYLGVNYAVTSPFGFSGAFWYARVTADF